MPALFEPDDLTHALFSRLSVAESEYDPRKLTLLLDELAVAPQVHFSLPVPTDPRLKDVVRHCCSLSMIIRRLRAMPAGG